MLQTGGVSTSEGTPAEPTQPDQGGTAGDQPDTTTESEHTPVAPPASADQSSTPPSGRGAGGVTPAKPHSTEQESRGEPHSTSRTTAAQPNSLEQESPREPHSAGGTPAAQPSSLEQKPPGKPDSTSASSEETSSEGNPVAAPVGEATATPPPEPLITPPAPEPPAPTSDTTGTPADDTAPAGAGEGAPGATPPELPPVTVTAAAAAATEAGRPVSGFQSGQVVTGRVVSVDKKEVVVDLGTTRMGVIPARHIAADPKIDPTTVLSAGDEVEAAVLAREDPENRIVLSRAWAQKTKAWAKVEGALASKQPITGVVTAVVRGGLVVDVGLRAFLPASHIDVHRVSDLASFVGQTVQAHVTELDRQKDRVVLSRREIVRAERREAAKQLLSELEVGAVRTGKGSPTSPSSARSSTWAAYVGCSTGRSCRGTAWTM